MKNKSNLSEFLKNEQAASMEDWRSQPSGAVEVKARAKAFSGEGVREHKFAVYADGTVRVWDSVAGHYTTVHSLSPSAQARIRTLAGQE